MQPLDSFPKIDAHIHFNAGRSGLLNVGQQNAFSFITINTEIPFFPTIEEQQELAQYDGSNENTRLRFITTISTENIGQDGWSDYAISKIEQDISNGALGVKFWKNIGMDLQRDDGSFIMLDAPELEPIFTYLEKQQIPVLGHQGEPRNCWLPVDEMNVKSDREYFANHPEYHMYLHEEYPDYWAHIEARDRVLEHHPDLLFIGLHLGSLEWSLDEVGQRLDRFPNMAVDLAERMSHVEYHASQDHSKVIDFFECYQDRIIYGTDIIDNPDIPPADIITELKNRWHRHWRFFTTDRQLTSSQIKPSFYGIKLPESILKKIYLHNARTWYQITD